MKPPWQTLTPFFLTQLFDILVHLVNASEKCLSLHIHVGVSSSRQIQLTLCMYVCEYVWEDDFRYNLGLRIGIKDSRKDSQLKLWGWGEVPISRLRNRSQIIRGHQSQVWAKRSEWSHVNFHWTHCREVWVWGLRRVQLVWRATHWTLS